MYTNCFTPKNSFGSFETVIGILPFKVKDIISLGKEWKWNSAKGQREEKEWNAELFDGYIKRIFEVHCNSCVSIKKKLTVATL